MPPSILSNNEPTLQLTVLVNKLCATVASKHDIIQQWTHPPSSDRVCKQALRPARATYQLTAGYTQSLSPARDKSSLHLQWEGWSKHWALPYEQIKPKADSPISPFAKEFLSLALPPHAWVINSLRNSYGPELIFRLVTTGLSWFLDW